MEGRVLTGRVLTGRDVSDRTVAAAASPRPARVTVTSTWRITVITKATTSQNASVCRFPPFPQDSQL
ncbi:hypothetical protein F2P81_013803 [Scophthalmus maximus]|uniref:Uncharacterized protein n=1 Tax=Scophthalmus maximus TaxID=52904 RepID=A0A6A4SKK5_SCOMX|nr:hypothetical protein F2P81_013803 [Scophthalmus maximus]